MGETRLAHDCAWEAAQRIMERIGGVFRDGEAHDAWELVLEHVQAAIETAFILHAREQRRLNPSSN